MVKAFIVIACLLTAMGAARAQPAPDWRDWPSGPDDQGRSSRYDDRRNAPFSGSRDASMTGPIVAPALTLEGAPSIVSAFAGRPTKFSRKADVAAAWASGPEIVSIDVIRSAVGGQDPLANFKMAKAVICSATAGSASCWAHNGVVSVAAGAGNIGGVVYEADLNVGNQVYPDVPGNPYAVNFFASGTTTNGAVGNAGYMAAYGGAGRLWHYGFLTQLDGFDKAAFGDMSNAPISLSITGEHVDGVNMGGAKFKRFALTSPGFILDGAGSVFSATLISGPLLRASNGAYPKFTMDSSSSAPDTRKLQQFLSPDGSWHVAFLNDAENASNDILVANRSGAGPAGLTINTNLAVSGGLSLPGVGASGAGAAGSLCVTAARQVYVKTTPGPCL